jgi:hypothetical protein
VNKAAQTISGLIADPKYMKQTPEMVCKLLAYHTDFTPLFEDREDLVLAQNQILGAFDFDLGAGILAKENAVASLHIKGEALAVLEQFAAADCFHRRLLRFLLRGVGNNDSTTYFFAGVKPLDHHTVV